MLNTYDNFTLNSIFRPKALIKKKHALPLALKKHCFIFVSKKLRYFGYDYSF